MSTTCHVIMFEQHLYVHDPVGEKAQQGQLFWFRLWWCRPSQKKKCKVSLGIKACRASANLKLFVHVARSSCATEHMIAAFYTGECAQQLVKVSWKLTRWSAVTRLHILQPEWSVSVTEHQQCTPASTPTPLLLHCECPS